MKKAQYADDIFTTEMEARGRSMDLGLNGEIHVSDYDGQVVYMPANSHEAYLDFYAGLAGLPTEDDTEEDMGESPASGQNRSSPGYCTRGTKEHHRKS
jgi:hypothetical protein